MRCDLLVVGPSVDWATVVVMAAGARVGGVGPWRTGVNQSAVKGMKAHIVCYIHRRYLFVTVNYLYTTHSLEFGICFTKEYTLNVHIGIFLA